MDSAPIQCKKSAGATRLWISWTLGKLFKKTWAKIQESNSACRGTPLLVRHGMGLRVCILHLINAGNLLVQPVCWYHGNWESYLEKRGQKSRNLTVRAEEQHFLSVMVWGWEYGFCTYSMQEICWCNPFVDIIETGKVIQKNVGHNCHIKVFRVPKRLCSGTTLYIHHGMGLTVLILHLFNAGNLLVQPVCWYHRNWESYSEKRGAQLPY